MAKHPRAPKIYPAFSQFTQRCLVEDRSLLWPAETIWTLENLEEIKQRFIDNPETSKGDFWEKLRGQFAGAPQGAIKALADAVCVYTLPSMFMRREVKIDYLRRVCQIAGLPRPALDRELYDALDQGFCKTGFNYHVKYRQLWLLLYFAYELRRDFPTPAEREAVVSDARAMEERLDRALGHFSGYDVAHDMRHALLHLAFPELYERIISNADKDSIVRTFLARVPDSLKNASRDEKIRAIRASFENQASYADSEFDFYNPEIRRLWKPRHDSRERPGDAEGVPEPDDPLLGELVALLRRRKQIILHGPPGTGKTWYARQLARTVVAADNFNSFYEELDDRAKTQIEPLPDARYPGKSGAGPKGRTSADGCFIRHVTFHPAYGYEDFVEGYRPVLTESGAPHFALRDGLFKRLCRQAAAQPDKTFVLLIDEINRGNIPRIFGELITLMEPDKRQSPENPTPYTAILPASGEVFAVPDNLLIIGTMNTADRSIALVDIALRRRFGFWELLPAPELLEDRVLGGLNVGRWLRRLNERIAREVGINYRVGHAYLINVRDVETFADIVRDSIFPLLQEYCYDEYAKLEAILGRRVVNAAAASFTPEVMDRRSPQKLIEALALEFGLDDGETPAVGTAGAGRTEDLVEGEPAGEPGPGDREETQGSAPEERPGRGRW